MTKRIYLIAGEASGDLLGAKLISAIREQNSHVEFYGIGGELMSKRGIDSLFPMSELSMMGFLEIVPHIPRMIKRINQTVENILALKPDVVVTIDSPGFCFRVAKKLQGHGIKLVHYVAPSVWAYKPKRAEKIARLYDYLIEILPFEKPYFDKVGLPNSYVGHPVVEDVMETDNKGFYKKYKISKKDVLVCVMPGSRKAEVQRILPIFTKALEIISQDIKNLHLIVPTIENVFDDVSLALKDFPIKSTIFVDKNDKYAAFNVCQAGLIKSGTSTLEAAIYGLPMVVAYKVNPLTYLIAKSMVKVKYVSIVNLILNKEFLPEFIQDRCSPDLLAKKLQDIILKKKRLNISSIYKIFGGKDGDSPSKKAAKVILSLE